MSNLYEHGEYMRDIYRQAWEAKLSIRRSLIYTNEGLALLSMSAYKELQDALNETN